MTQIVVSNGSNWRFQFAKISKLTFTPLNSICSIPREISVTLALLKYELQYAEISVTRNCRLEHFRFVKVSNLTFTLLNSTRTGSKGDTKSGIERARPIDRSYRRSIPFRIRNRIRVLVSVRWLETRKEVTTPESLDFRESFAGLPLARRWARLTGSWLILEGFYRARYRSGSFRSGTS